MFLPSQFTLYGMKEPKASLKKQNISTLKDFCKDIFQKNILLGPLEDAKNEKKWNETPCRVLVSIVKVTHELLPF